MDAGRKPDDICSDVSEAPIRPEERELLEKTSGERNLENFFPRRSFCKSCKITGKSA